MEVTERPQINTKHIGKTRANSTSKIKNIKTIFKYFKDRWGWLIKNGIAPHSKGLREIKFKLNLLEDKKKFLNKKIKDKIKQDMSKTFIII